MRLLPFCWKLPGSIPLRNMLLAHSHQDSGCHLCLPAALQGLGQGGLMKRMAATRPATAISRSSIAHKQRNASNCR